MVCKKKVLKIELNQIVVNHYILPDVIFNGPCLINGSVFIPKK